MAKITTRKILALIPCSLMTLLSGIGFADNAEQQIDKATFAGGCFWCMEKPFDELPGVLFSIPGYTGGHIKNPSYELVSKGKTGHYEAIQVIYDSNKISYKELLQVFWRNIDPLDGYGQFCDDGPQYRSAIFYHNSEQKRLAEQSKEALNVQKAFSGKIRTSILPLEIFYPAEDYHHDYHLKNPLTYKFYRFTCGRDRRLRELWGQ